MSASVPHARYERAQTPGRAGTTILPTPPSPAAGRNIWLPQLVIAGGDMLAAAEESAAPERLRSDPREAGIAPWNLGRASRRRVAGHRITQRDRNRGSGCRPAPCPHSP